jgi:hypothetical protein
VTTATRGCLIAPPSRLLLWTEPGRVLFEALATVAFRPLLRMVPPDDGHSVLALCRA